MEVKEAAVAGTVATTAVTAMEDWGWEAAGCRTWRRARRRIPLNS